VGKPSSKDVGADHVLSSIPAAERRILDVAVEVSVDAIESIVSGGIAAAMQDFNGR
jgi:peptidyl-tRNA hydrolase